MTKQDIYINAKEVREVSAIKMVAQLLQQKNWIATDATIQNGKVVIHLVRIF